MNRRKFMQFLAGLPFLGFLKPDIKKPKIKRIYRYKLYEFNIGENAPKFIIEKAAELKKEGKIIYDIVLTRRLAKYCRAYDFGNLPVVEMMDLNEKEIQLAMVIWVEG